jgi:hypothetical protein
MKRCIGFNPVVLAQKSHYSETLGWYQPTDFSPKKLLILNAGLVATQ